MSVTPRRYVAVVANLSLAQYAGSWSRSVDLESYISGYFDGEGCFTVSISPRPAIKLGWEARPSASVSQNADRSQVLDIVQTHFGCGTIRPDRSDKTVKWEVRKLAQLQHRVIPHFVRYPMMSGKQQDFERFALVCELMARKRHRTVSGLVRIVELAAGMNPSGKRRYDPNRIIDEIKMKA